MQSGAQEDYMSYVDDLIRMFNNTEPLSIEECEQRSRALRPNWIEMRKRGETFEQWRERNQELLSKCEDAKNVLAERNPHNQSPSWDATHTKLVSPNQDFNLFKVHLSTNKQDLIYQCKTVMAYMKLHLIAGEPVPPYYAERVAILLRKAKEHEKEKQWLVAWCRHFAIDHGYGIHGTYAKLMNRAQKLGVI